MHFEIDKNSQGQWIWRLRANNGRIVAVSGESYHNRVDCENGINLVKAVTSSTTVKDVSGGAGILGGLGSLSGLYDGKK